MKVDLYYNNGDVDCREAFVGVFRSMPNFTDNKDMNIKTEGFVYQDNGKYYYENWDGIHCLGNFMDVLKFIDRMRALGFACALL